MGAIAALTVIGLVALWPYGWHPPGDANSGGVVTARVQKVLDVPCGGAGRRLCRSIVATVRGQSSTIPIGPTRLSPQIGAGDTVRLMGAAPSASAGGQPYYEFYDVERHGSLLWIGGVVALVAVALLRWRGLLAVAGVALSLAVVVWFLVPAILAGRPALLVALVASLAVMFVTVILTNGLGAQSLAAALGVSATLVLTCLLALFAVRFANLYGDVEMGLASLGSGHGTISLRGIILAAMLVGALGVLADTAVTQASAVMALRRANPLYDARRLFREAFVIGRDHLSATIHTLVLAYASTLLPLLLVLRNSHVDTSGALNRQAIAEPIVATAVGCLALIVAVPLTTGLAAVLVARVPVGAIPDGPHHHH